MNFGELLPMPQFMIQRPKPRLGITVESMDNEMKKDLKIKKGNGIIITNVIDGSNAQMAGLKLNDVILKIDGIPVTTPIEVKNQVESKTVGSNLEIQLKRYGKSKKIIAVLNEFCGKWDESLSQTKFDPSTFPDLNWIDESGNVIFIPLTIEEKIKLIEELNQSKIQQEEKEKK
jgi:membrane-associated protease RseP (regulator of RpoE activity)